MKKLLKLSIGLTGFAIAFGSVLAAAQTANDLVGTWRLVSIAYEQNGKTTQPYGANPKGIQIFGSDGRVAVVIVKSDLPKFASNNRIEGTAEENKAVIQGSLAYFGTYSVSETDNTVTVHIESCSFPNWNGIDQKRSFTISGDELKWSTPTTTLGSGTALDVFKRAK